jgi:glycosyltransferase involved in cell wall biosynthesis
MRPTKDQPLVTFALFAYNQEKYIREAVEGAFSQTYEPLEIILSDDCSTDKTFKIMEEMAKNYKGPHKIVLNRNEVNLGLANHLNFVAKMASSEIIVVAAGDDKSFPWRVSTLAAVFQKFTNAMAIYSNYRIMDKNNSQPTEMAARKICTINQGYFDILFCGGGVGTGATYAYRRQCFFWPERLPGSISAEDKILPLRGIILGKVVHIVENLIDYRVSESGLGSVMVLTKKLPFQDPIHLAHLKNLIHIGWKTRKLGIVKYKIGLTMILQRVVIQRQVEKSKMEQSWSLGIIFYASKGALRLFIMTTKIFRVRSKLHIQ